MGHHFKQIVVSVFILSYFIIFSKVYAIEIVTSKNSIKIGEEVTVTVDFGTYIAAYDSYELSYNENLLKYNSDYALTEILWWDNTEESKGINKKVYSFTGKSNGINTFRVSVKGLVSANNSMDLLGDLSATSRITVGTGVTMGDLNHDSLVNADDAAIALDLYKYNNATEEDIEVGDMNGDELINADDAAIILDMYKYNK